MKLNRRQFIRLNAAALAGAALTPTVAAGGQTGPGSSAASTPRNLSPGFYRFTLGNLEITVLSDGSFLIPSAFMDADMDVAEVLATDVDRETREQYFRSRMVPSDDVPLQASPVLLDFGNRRVLVDSGWATGAGPPPTVGHLGSALEVAGIGPERIDVVILTHAHPDHLGGLLHPTTGEPFFPNAEVILSDLELESWTGDDPIDSVLLPEIRMVLGALDGRLRPVPAGAELVSGIRSIPSPGHTPGHIALGVEAGREELFLVGDAITNIHAAFEHPDWHFLFDLEPERAGRTRKRLLDQAATDRMLILGYHFPFPGLGYALREGRAYQWYPAGWRILA